MVPVGSGDGPQINPTASVAKNTSGMSTHFRLPSHGTCHPHAINSLNSLLAHFLHRSCVFLACFFHIPCTVLACSSHASSTLLAPFLYHPRTFLSRCFHTPSKLLAPFLHAPSTLLFPFLPPLAWGCHTSLTCLSHSLQPCWRVCSCPTPAHPTPLSGRRYGVRAPSFCINLGFIMPAGWCN